MPNGFLCVYIQYLGQLHFKSLVYFALYECIQMYYIHIELSPQRTKFSKAIKAPINYIRTVLISLNSVVKNH